MEKVGRAALAEMVNHGRKNLCSSGRRVLTKAEHFDAGGDVTVMSNVNVVADMLLEAIG